MKFRGSCAALLALWPVAAMATPTPFSKPEAVIIDGLPIGANDTVISTEEPFLSRDGQLLFFNSGEAEGNKDLYWAEQNGDRWRFRGAVISDKGPINTETDVQGNPTMDSQNHLYFVDSGVDAMVRSGTFDRVTGQVRDLHDVRGALERDVRVFSQKASGNMGVEVSASGKVIFFCRATWQLNVLSLGKLIGSDILMGKVRDNGYIFDESESRRIMERINSEELEYAPTFSTDGREVFYTRFLRRDMDAGNFRTSIMHAIRPTNRDPFDIPTMVSAIGDSDFVEGPALSHDETELYYHKRVGPKNRLFKVSRTL